MIMIMTNFGIDLWRQRVEQEGMAFTREAEEIVRRLPLILDHVLGLLCRFMFPIVSTMKMLLNHVRLHQECEV